MPYPITYAVAKGTDYCHSLATQVILHFSYSFFFKFNIQFVTITFYLNKKVK